MKKNVITSALDHIIRSFREEIMFMRKLTAELRPLPDFLIIGAQKAGTTSLYYYLAQHPQILPAFKKEVHYFDLNKDKGLHWYKSFFPSIFRRAVQKIFVDSGKIITGESTPYYLFHTEIPKRISQLLPNVKIIIMLRNPIDRAYSHYNHAVRNNLEKLPFEEAIRSEEIRLKDNEFDSRNYKYFSYLSRGIYINQLRNWLEYYPKEQLLILKSEEFYDDPSGVTRTAFKFLGLPDCQIDTREIFKKGSYESISQEARNYLQSYFKPYNKELEQFMSLHFGWKIPLWDWEDGD